MGAFLEFMDQNFHRAPNGRWSASLPFKLDRQRLPNSRDGARRRADLLDINLKKNPLKKTHMLEFMSKIFENSHAEIAPELC